MKKTILASILVAAAAACFGGADDTIVTFSTKGPDRYGDGSVVLDGECYALVWTASGATFGGFAANGSLVSATDKLVLVAGLAEGGKCPTTVFEIAAADVEANYKNGTFALYLLDTRVKDAAGKVKVGGKDLLATKAPAVNAAGEVAAGVSTSGGGSVGGATTTSLAEVGVYSKIGEPKITGFAVSGATVKITVEGMEPVADYFVVPGNTPGSFKAAKDVKAEGNTFTFEKKDGENFFKVIGARQFK